MNFPFCRSPMKGSKGAVGKPAPPQSHPLLEFLSKPTESTKDRFSTKHSQGSASRNGNGPKVSKKLPDAFNLPQSPKQGSRPFKPKLYHFQNYTANRNDVSSEHLEHLASVDDVRQRKLTIDSEDSKKQETAEYVLFEGKVRRNRQILSSKPPEKFESPVRVKSTRVLSGEPHKGLFLIKVTPLH